MRPFPLATGVGLLFGYTLLGATWLVMKTEGDLQAWARSARDDRARTACSRSSRW